ncbi:hypothetical protein BpHYR1_054523 [Brachionus plicatilis]|uniref:Uncharacterized protein n=1 Tax=Brachionus plicatilis TaxID=10195 RepID=A0A3M7S2V2_BRAPC|nr:hypothetical protein BpHYR1_054523 [Brachionus plicatilis]
MFYSIWFEFLYFAFKYLNVIIMHHLETNFFVYDCFYLFCQQYVLSFKCAHKIELWSKTNFLENRDKSLLEIVCKRFLFNFDLVVQILIAHKIEFYKHIKYLNIFSKILAKKPKLVIQPIPFLKPVNQD